MDATKQFLEAEWLLEQLKLCWCPDGIWKHGNCEALYREACQHVDKHLSFSPVAQCVILGCKLETLVLNGGVVPCKEVAA